MNALWIKSTAIATALAAAGNGSWYNSDPLTPGALHGKVALVNFWTYSCINSLRPLPYLKTLAEQYKAAGLIVIGVHTPEFGFEHDHANVATAVRDLGLPIRSSWTTIIVSGSRSGTSHGRVLSRRRQRSRSLSLFHQVEDRVGGDSAPLDGRRCHVVSGINGHRRVVKLALEEKKPSAADNVGAGQVSRRPAKRTRPPKDRHAYRYQTD